MINGSISKDYIELADPGFETPGVTDLVLGTGIFGQVVLHGRWFGHRGLPMALKTHFKWVLSCTHNTEKQEGSKTCCLATTGAGSRTGQGSWLGQNIYVGSHRASSTILRKDQQSWKAIQLLAGSMFMQPPRFYINFQFSSIRRKQCTVSRKGNS